MRGTLPAHVLRIEALDAPDQGVLAHVAAQRLVAGVALEIHEPGEALVGAVGVWLAERVDHRAPVGVVERDPTGGIDAAEADDDG